MPTNPHINYLRFTWTITNKNYTFYKIVLNTNGIEHILYNSNISSSDKSDAVSKTHDVYDLDKIKFFDHISGYMLYYIGNDKYEIHNYIKDKHYINANQINVALKFARQLIDEWKEWKKNRMDY